MPSRSNAASDVVLWSFAFFPWIDFVVRVGGERAGLAESWTRGWDELLITAGLAVALRSARRGSSPERIAAPSVLVPFGAFLFTSVLSVVVNRVPAPIAIDALRVAFQPALITVIAFLALRGSRRQQRFLDLVILSAVLVGLVALIQFAFDIEGPRWMNKPNAAQFRAISVFANPNALAAYLTMALSLTLCFASTNDETRTAYVAAAFPLAAGVVVTFSRGAWIACLVMVCVLGALASRKRSIALVAVAAFCVAVAVAPRDATGRAAELIDPAYYRQSAKYGRLSFVRKAVVSVRANPIFGVGPGMYGGGVALRHGVSGADWVDNHYLKVAAESGLPGLAAFLWLVVALGRRADRVRRCATGNDRAIGLGVLGATVALALQSATVSVSEALYVGTTFAALIGVLVAVPAAAGNPGRCGNSEPAP